jgi:hypothetical protein
MLSVPEGVDKPLKGIVKLIAMQVAIAPAPDEIGFHRSGKEVC